MLWIIESEAVIMGQKGTNLHVYIELYYNVITIYLIILYLKYHESMVQI